MLPFKDTYPKEMMQAAGLLAIPPGGRSSVYEVREPFAPSFLISVAALTSSLGPLQPITLGRH
jgi:hypothetical protein